MAPDLTRVEYVEELLEEMAADGLVDKRRRADGAVEYRLTDKGKREWVPRHNTMGHA